jgi:hypothetical protein
MKKKLSLFGGIFLLAGLSYMLYVRNCYNIVSREEILAVREKLTLLSPEEKRDLAFFIKEIIVFDSYPYTLVGYKPMSMCCVIIEDTEDLCADWREDFKRPRHQTEMRGWLTWVKYQSLFPLKKHILINYSFMGRGRKEIALICPQLCMATIEKNLGDFQEILGKQCTSEEVFEILVHPEHAEFYTIIDHARLFGILLGFGRNNAYLYEKHQGYASRSNVGYQQTGPNPLQGFSNDRPWPGALLSPTFACDPTTEETQQLKKHYNQAQKFVRWTYFLRNHLEVTLALLMQN